MKSSKKKSKKKKKPSPAATAGPAPTPPGAADSSSGASCSSRSETLTLAAAAAALETESSGGSSGEAAAYTSAFTSSSSGGASTSSSSASSASSSATGDERRDLAWLFDAFGSATIDQVDSAYREAGGDSFLAAGILGSTQDPQPPQSPPPPDLSPRAGSGGRKAARRPKRVAVAATGMVADVIGKGYTRSAIWPVSATNAWTGRDGVSVKNSWKGRDGERYGGCGDRKCNVEEAEQFLCSMLGDNSELGMGVVRDVLGQYGRDVEKALDALLDISGMSSLQNMERCFPNAEGNGMHSPNVFPGNGLSKNKRCFPNAEGNGMHSPNVFPGNGLSKNKRCFPNAEGNGMHSPNVFPGNGLYKNKSNASINQSPRQLTDEIPSMTYNHYEKEHEFLWGELQNSHMKSVCEVSHSTILPSRSTAVQSKMPQQVLESLFKIPEQRTYEPSSMDWKKVVKKLQSFNHPITANNQERPANGDGYQEFRGVAARHYDTMKAFYQKAALAYSKGEKAYASYLAEEGKHYRELARKEDEKASREIFEARNKHITNTLTIDLHGQHVKQAMRLLKVHMIICVCMPSAFLRVITGCGVEGTGKKKNKAIGSRACGEGRN